MIHLQAAPGAIELTHPSDVTFVDHAVELLRNVLRYQGLRDPSPLLLVVRELLRNAVVHGNRNDLGLPVRLRLTCQAPGQYCVDVEDQGRGFEDGATAGHGGFQIIRSLATEVRFHGRGNRVTALVDVGE